MFSPAKGANWCGLFRQAVGLFNICFGSQEDTSMQLWLQGGHFSKGLVPYIALWCVSAPKR